MAEETIWILGIDGESALSTLEELIAACETLQEAMSQVAASAGDLSGLDEALSTVATTSDEASTSVGGLDEAMAQLQATISEDTAIIDGLNETVANLEAQLAALTVEESTAGEGAGGLAAALAALGDMAEGVGGALEAAQGPLMMLSTAAIMAGGAFFKAGMDGQKGEALLAGMAGASQSDIEALQQEAIKLGVGMKEASAGFYEVESAGYSGSQAITVFDNAMKLAEGGQAQAQDVMTGLTAIMHDYNISADKAGSVTDIMAETVLRGKQSMQDFATSIGPLAAAGQKAGESFQEVAAAEATMTQINPHVRQDTQQLAALFDSLDPKMGKVEKTAKTLGLSFDDTHYKSLDLLGKLQYLAQIAGGETTPAFAKLVGGVRGATAATDLLQGKASTFIDNLHAMGTASGATENAFKTWESTVPAALDHVSAAFSVLATRVMDAIGPKIAPVIDGLATTIGHMADFVTQHVDIVMPVLAGLATMFGVILVSAIAAFLIPLLEVAAPFLAIAAAIGLVVAGAMLLVQHWNQITSAMGQNPAIKETQKILQEIGSFIASTFAPVTQQLATTWKTQVLPAFQGFAPVVEPIKMLLGALAMIIGTVLVVALAVLNGALKGIVLAVSELAIGFIQAFGGIVQGMMGFIQIVSGLLAFLVDLFTGNWGKISADLGVVWTGILTMASGFGNMLVGIFTALFGAVGGLVAGFITGIIDFFIRLFDELVGHSIIPDMINGIIDWFEQLPGRAGAAVQSMISTVMGLLGGLVNDAIRAGSNIVNGIAQGIQNSIGAVGSAISNVASFISSHLPHSPAKIGPLKDLALQGSLITEQISEGMLTNLPKLQSALGQLTQPISMSLQPAALPTPGNISSPVVTTGNDQQTQYLAQIAMYLAQMLQIQQQRQGNVTMNNSFGSGPLNPQALNQLVQALSGWGYESVQRGGL